MRKIILFFLISLSLLLSFDNAKAEATTYYYQYGSEAWRTTSSPSSIDGFLYTEYDEGTNSAVNIPGKVFTVIPGATYYYKRGDGPWQTTTNPAAVPHDLSYIGSDGTVSAYAIVGHVFTAVPGATYWYKYGDNPWESTTNPSAIPSDLNREVGFGGGPSADSYVIPGHVFTVLPGASYRYSGWGGSWNSTSNPSSIPNDLSQVYDSGCAYVTVVSYVVVTVYSNNLPTINITSPLNNQYFSNQLTLSGTVRDQDVGDILTVNYNVDGGATQTVAGTVTANGAEQAFASTNITVSGLFAGAHTINAWVADNKAGTSSVTSISIFVDKTAPTIGLAQAPAAGTWTNGSVTVTATVTDASSGVAVKRWAAGNQTVAYFTGGTGGNALGASFSVSANGIYTVYAKDNAGNERVQTISIANIDTTAPSIGFTQAPAAGTWTNGSVTVTDTVTDAASGVAIKRWAAGNQVVAYFTGGTGGNALGASFSVSANGIYTVYARDNAGNERVQTISIANIDTTAPSIGLNQAPAAGTWINGSVTVTDTVTDAASGVATKRWAAGNQVVAYFSGGTGGNALGASFSVSSNSIYTVYAKDNAGNERVQTISIANIDTTAPSIGLTQVPAAGTWTNGSVLVSSTIADGGSGISVKRWAAGNQVAGFFGGGASGNALDPGDTFTVASNGDYTVYACDAVGNEDVVMISINNIDTTAPDIGLSQDPPAGTWTSGSVVITPTITDGGSGISVKRWAAGNQVAGFFSGGAAGSALDPGDTFTVASKGDYTVYACDAAGNESVLMISVSNIDITPPVVLPPTLTVDSSTQITVSANASDAESGLHGLPFMFNRDGVDVMGWMAGDFVDTGLLPNMCYTYRYKARDFLLNESNYSVSTSVYTLALDPISMDITALDSTSVTFSVYGNPDNANVPEYRIEVFDFGAGPGGTAVAFSDFDTDTEGRIITGITPNTNYEVWILTRNGDGVANAPVKLINSFTSSAPVLIGVSYSPGGQPDTTRITLPTLPPGAARFESKKSISLFSPLPLAGTLYGGEVLTAPFDVPASPDDFMGVAAVDSAGGVIQFVQHKLDVSEVSVLDSVYSDPSTIDLPKGFTQQLYITANYTGGSVINVTGDAAYASSDESVSTVDLNGLVTAINEGFADISVTYKTKNILVPVTVGAPVATELTISPAVNELQVNKTQQYQATIKLSDNTTTDVTDIAFWDSSDPTKATVDKGLVTAHSAGSVFISASHLLQISMIGVNVVNPPSGGGVGGTIEPVIPDPLPPEPEPQPEPEPESEQLQPEPEPQLEPEPVPQPEPEPEPEPVPELKSLSVPTESNNQPTIKIGTIYGRVTDEQGNPIPYILVELHSVVQTTFTDVNGYYRFDNVEIGKHSIYLKDERGLIDLASVVLSVKPGLNRIESVFGRNEGESKINVTADAEGEQVNIVISEEKLALIRPPDKKPVSDPKLNDNNLTVSSIAVVAGGGAGGLYLFLLPFKRRKNVIVKSSSGKVLAGYKFKPSKRVILDLTSQIKYNTASFDIIIKRSLIRKLSLGSAIVLRYGSHDLSVYFVDSKINAIAVKVDPLNLSVNYKLE